MRSLVVATLAMAVVATAASGQSLEERYKKKLAKDFVKKIHWETSIDAAKARAKKEGKLIYAYFTRSYAP